MPLIVLFSITLTLRGHHLPGGGFAGGLVASAAFTLHALANGCEATRRVLRVDLQALIALGLVTALLSGVVSTILGRPFLTGLWGEVSVPNAGAIALGTPLIFDFGVYLVVFGVTQLMVHSLLDD
jgi:multicomponent Na+:H+ antiporter subunit B